MSEGQESGGTYQVGRVTGGTVAFGPYSQAHHHEVREGTPALDEATRALLEAVRGLRGELGALAVTDATAEAGRELEAAETEIRETGEVSPGRLRRLRDLVASGTAGLGVLASAATVAEAVAALLG